MNADKRIIVYPQYIDAAKTVAEGRRVPKSVALEDPFVPHMMDCCQQLKLECAGEGKHYSRDWIPKGRMRVALKDANGKPINPEVPDRRTLLLKICELLAKHPARKDRTAMKAAAEAAGVAPSVAAAAASGSKPSTSAAPSKKGKKGKK